MRSFDLLELVLKGEKVTNHASHKRDGDGWHRLCLTGSIQTKILMFNYKII